VFGPKGPPLQGAMGLITSLSMSKLSLKIAVF